MEYKYYIALAIASPLALFAYIVALGYTPISEAFISIPSETEVLLFSVQAGIMAATLGHFIGTKRGLKLARVAGRRVLTKQPVKMKYVYILIICIVVAIFILPFVINAGADFSGTDGQGPDEILSSGYEPWFDHVGYEPDELGEIILFSSQVAVGSLILGYFVGYIRAKPDEKPT